MAVSRWTVQKSTLYNCGRSEKTSLPTYHVTSEQESIFISSACFFSRCTEREAAFGLGLTQTIPGHQLGQASQDAGVHKTDACFGAPMIGSPAEWNHVVEQSCATSVASMAATLVVRWHQELHQNDSIIIYYDSLTPKKMTFSQAAELRMCMRRSQNLSEILG